MPATDVIIVNWNSGEQLRECVDSLLGSEGALLQRIIIIDNGSSDGSLERVGEARPVTVIRAGENLGFARACNIGVEHASADYILLLNPDTRVYAGSIGAAVAFLEQPSSQQVGIVGVQTIDEHGQVHRSCARFPRPLSFLAHSFGLSALWPSAFPDHFMRDWLHDEDREVDHVIGAYFLVRRALWQQLGGMDERFFVYLEDLDFSLRARRSGWRTWFLARARIYHKGGGTSEQIRARRLFYSLRSRLLYAGKHFSRLGFAAVAAATLLVEPITRCVLCVARRQWSGLTETSRAYASLYAEVAGILRRAWSAR